MSSEMLHEPAAQLAPATIDRHRAIVSLMEELEAIDWYQQRVDATSEADLKAILTHNRDEEKEHAAMVVEWLRRHDPELERHLRTHLFQTGSIAERAREEEAAAEPKGATAGLDGSLGIGGLCGGPSR